MDTEKTKNSLTDIDSLTGDFPALTPARFFSLCSSCLCGFHIGFHCIDTV